MSLGVTWKRDRHVPEAVAIGEAMLEFAREPSGLFRQRFGGDTLNTAIYLARLGVSVDYLTALGDDEYSEAMLDAWRGEGVGTERVLRVRGAMPGLYVIETYGGERRFAYWRDTAPVRRLFSLDGAAAIEASIEAATLVYLSGISLAVLGEQGRARLLASIARARGAGAKIAFDTNYRPRLWPDPDVARAAFDEILSVTDILLASEVDLALLHGACDPRVLLDGLEAKGIEEIVLKLDAPGVLLRVGSETVSVPVPVMRQPVDSTAAGDSFNAAFLAARLAGVAPELAALAGHRLAGEVIGHAGAVIPRAAMPGRKRVLF